MRGEPREEIGLNNFKAAMLKWQEERHSPCGPAGWKARGWVHFGQSSNIPTPARSSFSWLSPQAHCFPSSGPPLHKCSLLMFLVTAANQSGNCDDYGLACPSQPIERRRYIILYILYTTNFLRVCLTLRPYNSARSVDADTSELKFQGGLLCQKSSNIVTVGTGRVW
jgi:hypothetical protein